MATNRLEVVLAAQVGEFKQAFEDVSKRVDKTTADIAKSNAEISKSVAAMGQQFAQSASAVDRISQSLSSSFTKTASEAVALGAGLLTAQAAAAAVSGAFSLAEKAVAATFGALSDAVTHTADLGDELLALSQKTGLSVESLSAFRFIAGQTNTSVDTISGAVFKLEQNLGAASKSTAEALKGIGLSLQSLKQQDPADAFASIVAKLGEIPNASDRAAAGVAIFGKSFKDIAQLTQENLPDLINQAKELGVVMSTETAIAADRYNDALGALSATAEGVQIAIGSKLLPAVIAFSEAFGSAFLEAAKQSGVSSEQFGKSIDQAVQHTGEAAGRFISIFATITDAVVTWSVKSVLSTAAAIEAQASLADKVIAIGRTIDEAATGGALSATFDRMEASVRAARKTVDEIVGPLVTAGSAFHTLAGAVEAAGKVTGTTFTEALAKVKDDIDKSAAEMRSRLNAQLQGAHQETAASAKVIASDLKFVADAIDRTDDAVQRFDTAQMQRELQDLAREARGVVDDIEDVDRRIQQFARSQDAVADRMKQSLFELNLPQSFASGFGAGLNGIGFTQGQINSFGLFGQQAAEKASAPFRTAFAKLGQELPQLLTRALQQNNIGAGIAVIAEGAAGRFADVFQEGLKRVKDAEKNGEFAQLTGKEIGAGIAAAALTSFATGFATGLQGNSTAGFLTSAIGGFVSGFAAGGPAGGFVGLGAGLAGYLTGVSDQADQERAQVEQSQLALLTQFHGIEALRKAMERAGFDFRRRGADPLTAETAEQFNGRIALMNEALGAYNDKLKAVAAASDALNRRTAAFGKQFEPLVTAKKAATEKGDTGAAAAAGQQIQELAQRTQPEFERISLFVRDTFAAIVRETGDAIGAINQLAPSFEVLKAGISDFGLTSSTVIDSLVGIFDTVNNDAFKPFFENIQASGQLLKGLFDANVLQPDTFQAVAADIGQSIQEIINRGGDMAQALALSAPQLQTLWEAQQRYGLVTDQTTASILAQAEQQGVVGEQFRDVNERILDVLLAIGDALGAAIPEGLRAIPRAAQEAGAGVRDSFGGAFDEVAGSVDAKIGGALRNVKVPAGEAGDEMRKALATQAEEAAKDVKGSLGGAFDDVSGRIRTVGGELSGTMADRAAAAGLSIKTNLGGALDGFQARGRTAADAVSIELAKIKAPDLTVKVDFDINDPKWKYQGDWNRQGGNEWHPDPIPLATGGIVRRPTLALVGESGPEAVIPLSRMSSAGPSSRPLNISFNIDRREFGRIALETSAEAAYDLGLVPR